VRRVRLFGLHLIDPGEQGIKINPNAAHTFFVDDGEVGCSTIELTDAGRQRVESWDPSQGLSCYTGGIDGHDAGGWWVHDNLIKGFWCHTGLSEHAVHFWTQSRDTVVERNRLIDNARGIGFGLGGASTPGPTVRAYADRPCPEASGAPQHYGGIIRGNFIWAGSQALFGSQSGFDSGIALESACGAKVAHNTVASAQAPLSSSIEYRFDASTSLVFLNNLMTGTLRNRGAGTASSDGNVQGVGTDLFVEASSGDLHLLSTASAALHQGAGLAPGLADTDIDGDPRPSSIPDVGADQRK
jgi:hypothetical protein